MRRRSKGCGSKSEMYRRFPTLRILRRSDFEVRKAACRGVVFLSIHENRTHRRVDNPRYIALESTMKLWAALFLATLFVPVSAKQSEHQLKVRMSWGHGATVAAPYFFKLVPA